jgi:hypothetical protein
VITRVYRVKGHDHKDPVDLENDDALRSTDMVRLLNSDGQGGYIEEGSGHSKQLGAYLFEKGEVPNQVSTD